MPKGRQVDWPGIVLSLVFGLLGAVVLVVLWGWAMVASLAGDPFNATRAAVAVLIFAIGIVVGAHCADKHRKSGGV